MNEPIDVLLVEDNPGDARLIELMLQGEQAVRYQVHKAGDLHSALQSLNAQEKDIVLLDLSLPDCQGLEGLQKLQSVIPDMPVVVLTGNSDQDQALQAVAIGAQDYLIKGEADQTLLHRSVRYALERQRWQSDIKQKNAALESSQANLHLLVEENSSGLLIVNHQGIILFANSAAQILLPDTGGQLDNTIFPYPLKIGESHEYEQEMGPQNTLYINVKVKEITWDKKPACLVQVIDISESKKNEAELKQRASYDKLTGLPNRALFMDRLMHALQRAERQERGAGTRYMVVTMMLDLDGFKAVNDTYGHSVGDQVLKSVADRLQLCLRKSDTVARYGGDEFMLLMESANGEKDAVTIAEKILDVLNKPFKINDETIRISTSIGISLYPWDGRDDDFLIDRADIAMYEAKKQGSCYRFYDPAEGK